MPVDLEPTDDGNVRIDAQGVADVYPQRPLGHDGPLYLCHFVTCPQANEWRNPNE